MSGGVTEIYLRTELRFERLPLPKRNIVVERERVDGAAGEQRNNGLVHQLVCPAGQQRQAHRFGELLNQDQQYPRIVLGDDEVALPVSVLVQGGIRPFGNRFAQRVAQEDVTAFLCSTFLLLRSQNRQRSSPCRVPIYLRMLFPLA